MNDSLARDRAGRLSASDIDALLTGRHPDPFGVLGAHDGQIRCLMPAATRVRVVAADGTLLGELEQIAAGGLFAGPIDLADHDRPYRLRADYGEHEHESVDPYQYGSLIGDLDRYLLGEGRHYSLYRVLGAHPMRVGDVDGTRFAVWAPNASRASVVGDFNVWDGRRHVMRVHHGIGVHEIFVPGVGPGTLYKYELLDRHGKPLPLKADPVGMRHQHPPQTASVVHGLPAHEWGDAAWMERRAQAAPMHAPMSVYEVHLGSWARVPEEGGRYLSYPELAERLLPYVKSMGFTHVELMPVSEYPFDGSWGYQPVGLYAPTIRHGTPEEFAAFVDRCHQAGVGVIIDWVPGHFPSDAHGLARFDGTALYEHEDPRQGFHQDWNTLIYNYGRPEVRNFLIANALYWLEQFHIDGLRVDAVASMLYLNYSRREGEWVPNRYGGHENLEAIEFLRELNVRTHADHPGSLTIAEESTAWPSVSRPIETGGLGFTFKWNMGWMHDTLRYFERDPVFRRHHQDELTFGLIYAFSENFVLPFSHDEVVHGKRSMLEKMPGDEWQQRANLRACYGFMWTHPGKKLLFMGCEFGQRREWSHERSLDWHLANEPGHEGLQQLVRDLNALYVDQPALHELDHEAAGFEWIDTADRDASVLIFARRARLRERVAVVICHFEPSVRTGYRIGVPGGGAWRVALNTDAERYGGSGTAIPAELHAQAEPWHGRPHSVQIDLPPLATVVLVQA